MAEPTLQEEYYMVAQASAAPAFATPLPHGQIPFAHRRPADITDEDIVRLSQLPSPQHMPPLTPLHVPTLHAAEYAPGVPLQRGDKIQRDVQPTWEYSAEYGAWKPCSPDLSFFLNQEWAKGATKCDYIWEANKKYEFNLVEMKQRRREFYSDPEGQPAQWHNVKTRRLRKVVVLVTCADGN